ncbi:hypothetical protein CEXT_217691 [Caerostris extrusa]|uniref:Uncharacterized protein n=1 Tax=Caerostris extrusa TaxID=172846 RepID=A0AAV4S642_CAEEX|nr:hypothetical protein CEXT_217691 [Caerostris extrusa]
MFGGTTNIDASPVYLPLARVELGCNLGPVTTKAVVIRNELDQGSPGEASRSRSKQKKQEAQEMTTKQPK